MRVAGRPRWIIPQGEYLTKWVVYLEKLISKFGDANCQHSNDCLNRALEWWFIMMRVTHYYEVMRKGQRIARRDGWPGSVMDRDWNRSVMGKQVPASDVFHYPIDRGGFDEASRVRFNGNGLEMLLAAFDFRALMVA